MLRALEPISERLKALSCVKDVRGANDLAQVLNGKTTGIDGLVYLIFEGVRPVDTATQKHQRYLAQFSVVYASQTYERNGIPLAAGKALHEILKALCGFSPLDDDKRSRQTLAWVNGDKPMHMYGLSLYPLRFELELILNFKD